MQGLRQSVSVPANLRFFIVQYQGVVTRDAAADADAVKFLCLPESIASGSFCLHCFWQVTGQTYSFTAGQPMDNLREKLYWRISATVARTLEDLMGSRNGFWNDRKILVTGHTGFKGSWMVTMLSALGCRVTGYALAPNTNPNLFDLLAIDRLLARNEFANIRDSERLKTVVCESEPELIVHMAAQPLVRFGYADPHTTWDTNVMGTVNLLEAARACASVRAVVVVTTDKCYENNGSLWGYREIDRLGGHDPYSASKAASELVVDSYRRSYFSHAGVLVASARGGNVIGGGDWSSDRLIPDAARAVAQGESLQVRNPGSTRPWQHVLDCVDGYLTLARRLLDGETKCATGYNFGPEPSSNITVAELLARVKKAWPELDWRADVSSAGALHEAAFLYLDSNKARRELNWVPKWSIDATVDATAEWYRAVQADPQSAASVTERQLQAFLSHG
ncbi:CDP-glucose 4,6-dehydratase [Nordella sp. HKS 07]|uniref:CDP-glucose 4,6-dehydratase n=1 Tax=Nordella sp. HKS 07 TaxID=2712222 RepID=UPI001FEFDB28|nr:CDP-glucose 4,6-dehydratase [Nordella sp. HKS 07]